MKVDLDPSVRTHLTRFIKFTETDWFTYLPESEILQHDIVDLYVRWLEAGEPEESEHEPAPEEQEPGEDTVHVAAYLRGVCHGWARQGEFVREVIRKFVRDGQPWPITDEWADEAARRVLKEAP